MVVVDLGRASTTMTSSSAMVVLVFEMAIVMSAAEGNGGDRFGSGLGGEGGCVLLGTRGEDFSLGLFGGRDGPPSPDDAFFFFLIVCQRDFDVTFMHAK